MMAAPFFDIRWAVFRGGEKLSKKQPLESEKYTYDRKK